MSYITLHYITDHFSRCQMSSPSIIVVIMDIIMNHYSEFPSGSFTHPAPSTFTCSHPDRPGILQHTQVLSEVLSEVMSELLSEVLSEVLSPRQTGNIRTYCHVIYRQLVPRYKLKVKLIRSKHSNILVSNNSVSRKWEPRSSFWPILKLTNSH